MLRTGLSASKPSVIVAISVVIATLLFLYATSWQRILSVIGRATQVVNPSGSSGPAVADAIATPGAPQFVSIPKGRALSTSGLYKVIEILTSSKVVSILRQQESGEKEGGKRVHTLDAMLFNPGASQLKAQRIVVVQAEGRAYLGEPLRDVSPTSGSIEARLEYGAEGAGTSLILDASTTSSSPNLELAPVLALDPNDTPRFYPFSEPRSYGFSGDTGEGTTAPPIDYSVIGSIEPLPRDRLHNTLAQEASMLNMLFR